MLLIRNGLTLEMIVQKASFINFVDIDVVGMFEWWYIRICLRGNNCLNSGLPIFRGKVFRFEFFRSLLNFVK